MYAGVPELVFVLFRFPPYSPNQRKSLLGYCLKFKGQTSALPVCTCRRGLRNRLDPVGLQLSRVFCPSVTETPAVQHPARLSQPVPAAAGGRVTARQLAAAVVLLPAQQLERISRQHAACQQSILCQLLSREADQTASQVLTG